MRVAFTGASSTGKTTLALELMKHPPFRSVVGEFVPSEGASLLRQLGFGGLDDLTQSQTAHFQLAYFVRKFSGEVDRDRCLVDRSFVDVAAHWLERDTVGSSEFIQRLLVEPCRLLARQYDAHFYFPAGLIPFEADGWRSTDIQLQQRLGGRIESLLREWRIPYATITTTDVSERVQFVLRHVGAIR